MTADYTKPEITKKHVVVFSIAVCLSWVLHELAHWAVGEYLGYKMGITLNKAYPLSGEFSKELHYQITTAAGPIFTLCEALLVFILMMHRKRVLLYPFIFTCFYMRLFATVISLRRPNDEAKISTAMGIGKFTLPIIVTSILFVLLYKVSKKYNFDVKFNLASLGLTILFSSLIILTDMYFKVRLI